MDANTYTTLNQKIDLMYEQMNTEDSIGLTEYIRIIIGCLLGFCVMTVPIVGLAYLVYISLGLTSMMFAVSFFSLPLSYFTIRLGFSVMTRIQDSKSQ